MKIEMEISKSAVAKTLAIVAIGIIIGYALGITTGSGISTAGGVDYLSTADLNRSDIQASILLSRFCEGLGLQSSVYWQQDAEGNVFGQPICLPGQ